MKSWPRYQISDSSAQPEDKNLLWSVRPSVWLQLVSVQIIQPGEGGHKGVGVSPSDRDPVQLAGQHIGGSITTPLNNNKT